MKRWGVDVAEPGVRRVFARELRREKWQFAPRVTVPAGFSPLSGCAHLKAVYAMTHAMIYLEHSERMLQSAGLNFLLIARSGLLLLAKAWARMLAAPRLTLDDGAEIAARVMVCRRRVTELKEYYPTRRTPHDLNDVIFRLNRFEDAVHELIKEDSRQ